MSFSFSSLDTSRERLRGFQNVLNQSFNLKAFKSLFPFDPKGLACFMVMQSNFPPDITTSSKVDP